MPNNKPTADLFELLNVTVRIPPEGVEFTPEPFLIIKYADWEKLKSFLSQHLSSQDYAKLPELNIKVDLHEFLPDDENGED